MDLRTVLRRALGAVALTLALALGMVLIAGAATASAPAPDPTKAKVKPMAKKRGAVARPAVAPLRGTRHLILIPGGGFTFHDAGFWSHIAPVARAAGFVPHLLKYRLFDLAGAVADARAFADDLTRRYGRANVFAYGSSAGGTLATLLASDGRVTAAAVSSGLYDFRYWPWATLDRGPDYLASIGADWDVRRTYSPIRHRLRCPILSLHGSWDPVVSIFQAEDYEATHPRAQLREYPAGHGLYRSRPGSVTAAIRWLNRTGNKQARLARSPFPRGARTAQVARRIRCA